MLAAVPGVKVENETADVSVKSPAQPVYSHHAEAAFGESGLERVLATGESLIQAGDLKTHVYRIDRGLVCSYWQPPDGNERRVVSFSFAGDVVGLGPLDRHIVSVEALADAVVQCLPRAAIAALVRDDGNLALRHAEAANVELQLLRQTLVAQGRSDTMMRVAALLCVLSSINASEGRQRDLITDDITCGFVAETLGLEVQVLEEALVGLARQGMIEARSDGALRIKDLAALERLAESRP